VITAVLAGASQSETARHYDVSQGWISRLMTRYRAEGEAAFEPRSRRPHTTPSATPPAVVQQVLTLRKQLTEQGLDAGAETIAWHLQHHHQVTVSRATIHRILAREGTVTPDPKKRPKASYIRFTAEQPNETWQSDFTHYRLTRADGRPGNDAEIITWLDDHSRAALHISAHHHITAPIVLDTFRQTCDQHEQPASILTDNGMVYTTRFAGGRGGRNHLEHELHHLGITQKNGRPNHHTTQGKVERFQQTMKKWLRAQPEQPRTTAELQALLDAFAEHYNHHRLRRDKIDKTGCVTLRIAGKLRHIGIGRAHAGTHVLLLVHDHDVRVINAATGEILRDLTIDLTRDYQPRGTNTQK
jgi:transposase InsO family protein